MDGPIAADWTPPVTVLTLPLLAGKESYMALNGIDATLRQLVSQLPADGQNRTNSDTFEKLIDVLSGQIKTAIDQAVAARTAQLTGPLGANPFLTAASTAPTTTPADSTDPAPAGRTTAVLSASQQRWLRQQGGVLLEALPGDTSAYDPRYNERADALRDGLDLDKMEQYLKSKAAQWGVDYHRSDLEGVLRNAGYGRNNQGSTEMYMATVEKFMANAEENYRQRSDNVPGQNA
jgi:hypothetical protein